MNQAIQRNSQIKKLILLKDHANKIIWGTKVNNAQGDLTKLKLGISYQTLNSGIKRNNRGLSNDTLKIICKTINKKYRRSMKRAIDVCDFSDIVDTNSFGDIFCLEKNVIKRILDDYHFSTGPLLPLFYTDSLVEAENNFKKIEGFYYLYRYGLTKYSFKNIHKIGLHIRRILKTRQGYVIRCKMLVVDDTESTPYKVEYDGYVYNANNIYSFIFTPRVGVEWSTLSVVDNQNLESKNHSQYEGIYQSTMDNEDGSNTQLQFRRTLIHFMSKDPSGIDHLFDNCCTFNKSNKGEYQKYNRKLRECYQGISYADVFPSEYNKSKMRFGGDGGVFSGLFNIVKNVGLR